MQPKIKADRVRLLADVGKLHSLLGVVWTNPTVPETAKGSTLIGTKLFASLETGIRQIDQQLNLIDLSDEIKMAWNDFWKAFTTLYSCLKTQGVVAKDEAVCHGLNVLYLASGIFYHGVKGLAFPSWPSGANSVTSDVEDLPKLLRSCKYERPTCSLDEVFFELIPCMTKLTGTFR